MTRNTQFICSYLNIRNLRDLYGLHERFTNFCVNKIIFGNSRVVSLLAGGGEGDAVVAEFGVGAVGHLHADAEHLGDLGLEVAHA